MRKYSVNNKRNLNKNSIETHYKLNFEIVENKLLINKLSSTILLFKTPNKVNIKRKLIETISYNIMKKYKSYFSFKSDYYPSLSELKEENLLFLIKWIIV